MSSVQWSDILGWDSEALEDLRFLGYAYLKQGKYEIARSIFEALMTLSNQNTYDLQTLGALYLETGKNLQALNTIEQALKLEPSHSETLLNRAKALFAIGLRRQGVAQANSLLTNQNKKIADHASALLLAYT
jgi:tetratricopeptide (TPR) repeat protein